MLNDLLTYYSKDNIPILPFMVSPFFEHQDTLILAPQSITKEHDDFLKQVFRDIPSFTEAVLYLRVFTYKSHIVITVVFPTNFKEDISARSGLVFTLGLILDRVVFRQYVNPGSSYFGLLVSLVNKLFEVDLFTNGADYIVSLVNEESRHKQVKEKLELLLDLFLTAISTIRPNKLHNALTLLRRKKATSLPKAILCNDINSESLINLFLSEIDRYLSVKRAKKIDISNHSIIDEASMVIVKLDHPMLNSVNSVRIVRHKNKKHVILY